MKTCKCNESLGNTGTAKCIPIFKVVKKPIIVPTYDNEGNPNRLDLSVPLTQLALNALLNHADPSKRWYPLPTVENVTGERGESQFETAPSGKKAFIKQGTRSMSFEIWEQSSEYKTILDKIKCNEASVFLVDVEGNERGMVPQIEDGYFYPIKIDKNSFDVRLVMGTDTTVEKLVVSFDWDQNEDDSQLRVIDGSDFAADLLDARGLLDISSEISAISTTSFTAKLKTNYGSALNPVVDSGLLMVDFALYNVTDSASVTIASMNEGPNGTYVFTFAAQTSGDILRLTPTKNGRDYTNVVSNTILVP